MALAGAAAIFLGPRVAAALYSSAMLRVNAAAAAARPTSSGSWAMTWATATSAVTAEDHPHAQRGPAGAEGTRFTDAYAGCTVCAPSRSVLMTGKHTGHTPVRSNPGGTSIAAEDVTVAQVLKQAATPRAASASGDSRHQHSGRPVEARLRRIFGFLHQMHAHFHYPVRLYHNEREVLLPGNANGGRGTYASDAMADKALEFIRREKDRPFYCYLTPPFRTGNRWRPRTRWRPIAAW